jgi:type IV secretory pathway TrbD component
MAQIASIPGFESPVHRALTALGLGLRLWLLGLVVWAVGHGLAVWAAKRDPLFVEVVRRHIRTPSHLGV